MLALGLFFSQGLSRGSRPGAQGLWLRLLPPPPALALELSTPEKLLRGAWG